jgi:signal transduction histidine kinase
LTDEVDRLIAAEQDERRRIALFLHDGPVQNLAGIALMLDAALHAITTGKLDDARGVLDSALERQRATIRELRDLSFALEPVVLRDQGFGPALQALADQVGTRNQIRIDLDVADAERVGATAQVALYTIVRELLEQAVRRGPLTRVEVAMKAEPGGALETVVADGLLAARARRRPARGRPRVRGRRPHARRDEGRRIPAPRRPAALRLLARPLVVPSQRASRGGNGDVVIGRRYSPVARRT